MSLKLGRCEYFCSSFSRCHQFIHAPRMDCRSLWEGSPGRPPFVKAEVIGVGNRSGPSCGSAVPESARGLSIGSEGHLQVPVVTCRHLPYHHGQSPMIPPQACLNLWPTPKTPASMNDECQLIIRKATCPRRPELPVHRTPPSAGDAWIHCGHIGERANGLPQ